MSEMKKRRWPAVCVDLETLGTSPDSVILEIGVVCFDPVTGRMGPVFAEEVSGYGQERRKIDFDTACWWMEREREGLHMPGKKGVVVGLEDVLCKLESFWLEHIPGDAEVWAWGSDFDFPILKHAFLSYGFDLPWNYGNQRDARTFCKALGVRREGAVEHRAVADAIQEAEAVMGAMRKVRIIETHPEGDFTDFPGGRVYYHAKRAKVAGQPEAAPPCMDMGAGWDAYRRELLETVGMTMLPVWEELPEQVRESWCVGVQASFKSQNSIFKNQ